MKHEVPSNFQVAIKTEQVKASCKKIIISEEIFSLLRASLDFQMQMKKVSI